MKLLDEFQSGDIRALSKVISIIENRRAGYRRVLGQLYPTGGRSVRIGITGPPGAGKSSLVNCLTHRFLAQSMRVGIIAVDPSSPFTGGALLGDRVRMNEFPADGKVYFRSMATRGASGGLAAATSNVAVALDAFGFDITLIETVGVGQVELDVIDACDTVVVTVVPESGDAVQTMKAGLMEIADIFAVNKADRPGAEGLMADLKHTLHLKRRDNDDWTEPVIATQAINDVGIDKLHAAITDFIKKSKASEQFESHRRDQLKKKILAILSNRFRQEFLELLADKIDLDDVVKQILTGRTDPYIISDELYQQFSPRN